MSTAAHLDPAPDVTVVVLTRGDRNAEVAAAVQSALAQRGVSVEVVLVANGTDAAAIGIADDPRLVVVETPTDLGAPGGRDLAVGHARAAVIAFLDDDARYRDDEVLARAVHRFATTPEIGAIALRIVDDDGRTLQRHIPRVGPRGADRSGLVTIFLAGAVIMRADAYAEAGGYATPFIYAMEESDLALRMIDAGWDVFYDATPSVFHPRTDPSRHTGADARTMRNRVWMAHRTLPLPIAVVHVAVWLAISTLRNPRRAGALLRAAVAAWPSRPGPRRPIAWSTVARLTRLGRPPII